MIHIRYALDNYLMITKNVAQQIGAEMKGNSYDMPSHLGEGHVHSYSTDSISIMIAQFRFNDEVKIQRDPSELEGYLDLGFIYKGISTEFATPFENNFRDMGFGAYLSTPSTPSHSIIEPGMYNEHLLILVKVDWLEEFLNVKLPAFMSDTNKPLMMQASIHHDLQPVIHSIFNKKMAAELKAPYIYSKSLELITLFFHSLKEQTLSESAAKFHPEDLMKINELAEYLRSNIDGIKSIAELSKIYGLNRDKIQKAFKAVYGETIGSYHRSFRMNYAYNRILEGHRINEVAMELGYANMSHFSRAFKNVHGINPSSV